MLAALGGFIALVIFIGLAIIASLLKRKEDRSEAPPLWPPSSQPPPPPPRARNWEEELRRVLEESVLEPPSPPPLVRQVVPPPMPVQETEGYSDEGGAVFVPPASFEPAFQSTPRCEDARESYASAAQLPQRVAQHMADVTRHRVGLTTAHRAEIPASTLAAARSLRTHDGVRAAMIASIILGPPRALEGAGSAA